jgi:hypothetical protein
MNDSEELKRELNLWIDAELASPDKLLKDDPDLLLRCQVTFADFRRAILNAPDNKELYDEYKSLDKAFCDLLGYRCEKVGTIELQQ